MSEHAHAAGNSSAGTDRTRPATATLSRRQLLAASGASAAAYVLGSCRSALDWCAAGGDDLPEVFVGPDARVTVPHDCRVPHGFLRSTKVIQLAALPRTVGLLRAEDLVLLRTTFVDFDLAQDRCGRPRANFGDSKVCLLRFELPPQHIAETAYYMPETYVGFPKDKPFFGAFAGSSYVVLAVPRRREGDWLEWDVDELLDWRRCEAVLPEEALPGAAVRAAADPCVDPTHPEWVGPLLQVAPDRLTHTELELPFGLIVAPGGEGAWEYPQHAHLVRSRSQCEPIEPWHAAYATYQEMRGVGDAAPRGPAGLPTEPGGRTPGSPSWLIGSQSIPVRALRAYVPVCDRRDDPEQIVCPLPTRKHRSAIVLLSSCRHRVYGPTGCEPSTPYVPVPMHASKLLVGALGANTRMRGEWRPLDLAPAMSPPVDGFVLEANLARDEYVELSLAGYVAPFGHYVSFIRTRAREFRQVDDGGGVIAFLRQRYYCEIRTPLVEYPLSDDARESNSREFPFRWVRILPRRTPPLSPPTDPFHEDEAVPQPGGSVTGGCDRLETSENWFWIVESGSKATAPFLFDIEAEDRQGNRHAFKLPLLWISGDIAGCTGKPKNPPPQSLDDLLKKYNQDPKWGTRRTAQLAEAPLAFVPTPPTPGDRAQSAGPGPGSFDAKPKNQSFPAQAATFGVYYGPGDELHYPDPPACPRECVKFHPRLGWALLKLPEISEFGPANRKDAWKAARYGSAYAQRDKFEHAILGNPGFGHATNAGEVYLEFPDPPEMPFAEASGGGLATPTFAIVAYSRLSGSVGGKEPEQPVFARPAHLSIEEFAASLPAVRTGYQTPKDSGVEVFVQGRFDPAMFFGALKSAKLLGAVDLSGLLEPLASVAAQLEKIPKIVRDVKQEIDTAKARVAEIEREIDAVREQLERLPQTLEKLAHDYATALVRDAEREFKQALETEMREKGAQLSTALAKWMDDTVRPGIANVLENAAGKVKAEDLAFAFDTAARAEALYRAYTQQQFGAAAIELAAITDSFGRTNFTDRVAAAVERIRRVRAEASNILDEIRALPGALREFLRALEDAAKETAEQELKRRLGPVEQRLKTLGKQLEDRAREARDRAEKEVLQPAIAALPTVGAWAGFADKVLIAASSPNLDNLHKLLESAPDALKKRFEDVVDAGAVKRVADAARSRLESLRAAVLESEIATTIRSAVSELERRLAELLLSIPSEISQKFEHHTELHDTPRSKPLFVARGLSSELASRTATLDLKVVATKKLGLTAQDALSPPTMTVNAALGPFHLVLIPQFECLKVGFRGASFVLDGTSPSPKVDIRFDTIRFGKELTYLKQLADSFLGGKGLYLDVNSAGVSAGFRFELPSLGFGAFSLRQLAFEVGVNLPFEPREMLTRLAISSRDKPFLISVGILGGGGHFAIELTPKRIAAVEISLEFGGVIAIDVVVASGTAYVLVGVFYRKSDEATVLTGFVRGGGSVSVLGLLHISVEMYLGLTYETRGNQSYAAGEALFRVEIDILFFSIAVEFRVRREFSGSGGSPGGGSDEANAPLVRALAFGQDVIERADAPWTEAGWAEFQRQFATV